MYLTKFVTTPHTTPLLRIFAFCLLAAQLCFCIHIKLLIFLKCHIRAYACLGQTYFAQSYHFKLNTAAYSFNQINLRYRTCIQIYSYKNTFLHTYSYQFTRTHAHAQISSYKTIIQKHPYISKFDLRLLKIILIIIGTAQNSLRDKKRRGQTSYFILSDTIYNTILISSKGISSNFVL